MYSDSTGNTICIILIVLCSIALLSVHFKKTSYNHLSCFAGFHSNACTKATLYCLDAIQIYASYNAALDYRYVIL